MNGRLLSWAGKRAISYVLLRWPCLFRPGLYLFPAGPNTSKGSLQRSCRTWLVPRLSQCSDHRVSLWPGQRQQQGVIRWRGYDPRAGPIMGDQLVPSCSQWQEQQDNRWGDVVCFPVALSCHACQLTVSSLIVRCTNFDMGSAVPNLAEPHCSSSDTSL